MTTYGILEHPSYGIIQANGVDAAQFLNNQLSNNILKIQPNSAQLNLYCSAQGRTLASFIVLQVASEEFLLICSKDIIDVTLKRMNMFIMRSKVTLKHTDDFKIYAQTQVLAKEPNTPWSIQQKEDSFEVELPSVQNTQRQLIITKNTLSTQATLDEAYWNWLNILSGIHMISQTSREQFVPQMLNYESLNAIDFNKGCYPGQEVIARSQFRGSIKRRLYILHSEQNIQNLNPQIGDELFNNNEPVSNILDIALSPEQGWSALAVLPVGTSESSLHLKSQSQGSVHFLNRPYEFKDDF